MSRRRNGQLQMTDWFAVFAADGFYTAQDPLDPNIVYYESQGGNISRRNLATGETVNIKRAHGARIEHVRPADRARSRAPAAAAHARSGAADRRHPRADEARHGRPERRAALELEHAVLRLGARSTNVFYSGADKVFKSVKKGRDPIAISPDLSAHDPDWLRVSSGFDAEGNAATDALGRHHARRDGRRGERDDRRDERVADSRRACSSSGTDDGNVWITRNDGGTWDRHQRSLHRRAAR